MSVTLPSPPEKPRPAESPARREKSRRRDFDTLLPAIGITAILHLLLFEGLRHSTLFTVVAGTPVATTPAPLEVNRAKPDDPVPANLLPAHMRPPPPKLVQINPLAPSRLPDRTNNTGSADQRAAQPDPDSRDHAERANVKGEDKDSDRIVNAIPREFLPEKMRPAPGSALGAPVEKTKTASSGTPVKAADGPADRAAVAKGEPVADKGPVFAEKTGTSSPAKAADGDKKVETPTPKKTEGAKEGADKGKPADPAKDPGKAAPAGQTDDTPRPRPRASLAGTSGPLALGRANANEAGLAAADSRFSRMGEYCARMMEIIQAGWWASLERSRIAETGTVVVEFTLHKDGTVTGARIVEHSTSERAALLCLGAVTDRTPYDEWPEDMVGLYGDNETGRIKFHYR